MRYKYNKTGLFQNVEKFEENTAWNRGLKLYAFELLENVEDGFEFDYIDDFEKALLKGAEYWLQYSEGGCSLVCDKEIAKRLCTPSEFNKKKGGELPPKRYMSWIELQAIALEVAAKKLVRLIKNIA